MKKAVWFVIAIVLVAMLMVMYIYQNIQAIQVSYRIQQKERELSAVSDEYKRLVFEVNALHSPAYLESKIRTSGVQLIQPTNIRFINNMVKVPPTLFAKDTHENLLGRLEFMSEAHANSTES